MSYWSTIADAVGHWPMQDSESSTSVAAVSGPQGTLAGGDDTADLAEVGPRPWLPSALGLDGVNDYITTGQTAGTWSEATIALWAKPRVVQTSFTAAATRGGGLGLCTHSNGRLRYNWSNHGAQYTADGPEYSVGVWRHYAVRVLADRVDFFVDGVPASGWQANHPPVAQSLPLVIAADTRDPQRRFDGALAEVLLFDRGLSDAEVGALCLGPTPTVVVAPAWNTPPRVGAALNWNAGTWDSYSNGDVSFSWVLQQSADGVTGWSDVEASRDNSAFLIPTNLESAWARLAVTAGNTAGVGETSHTSAELAGTSWLGSAVRGGTASGGAAESLVTPPGAANGVVIPGEATITT